MKGDTINVVIFFISTTALVVVATGVASGMFMKPFSGTSRAESDANWVRENVVTKAERLCTDSTLDRLPPEQGNFYEREFRGLERGYICEVQGKKAVCLDYGKTTRKVFFGDTCSYSMDGEFQSGLYRFSMVKDSGEVTVRVDEK